MQLIHKNQLDDFLGKRGFSRKQLVGKLTYASGIPEIDDILGGKSFIDIPCLVNIVKRENGIEIGIMRNFRRYFTGIQFESLIQIALEDKNQIVERKEKSVIGRALLGGLVLGPVGAVIGGMTGLKDTKKIILPDLILSIRHKIIEGIEEMLLLTCAYKNKKSVERFFRKNFAKYYNVELIRPIQTQFSSNQNDIISQLERLAILHEKGALTEEEFIIQKNNLLKSQ